MTNLKQPALGIVATIAMIAVSLAFSSLFSFATFSGWLTFCAISCIPMQIVIGVTWGTKYPRFAGDRSQPSKGILLTLVTLVAGAIVAAVHFVGPAGGISPPPPMGAMCIILSVLIAFWLAIMFGGWPFTAITKSTLAAGLMVWVATYVINYLQFRAFMNFGFMRGSPVYVPSLDPQGMFNAWNFLVCELTVVAVMFLVLLFDLWPMTKSAAIMKQPVLGLVWTAICVVIGGLAFYIGTVLMGMDTVDFMVEVPIPFIFGTIVVLNMLQGSLFSKMAQPVKGLCAFVTSVVLGLLLAAGFNAVEPLVSGPLKAGPPAYDAEIWLASALLGVTFPFLVFYADMFKFWPLQRDEVKREVAVADGSRA